MPALYEIRLIRATCYDFLFPEDGVVSFRQGNAPHAHRGSPAKAGLKPPRFRDASGKRKSTLVQNAQLIVF